MDYPRTKQEGPYSLTQEKPRGRWIKSLPKSNEEKLAIALYEGPQTHLLHDSGYTTPTRSFEVGESVSVGNLKDVLIEQKQSDSLYLISFLTNKSRDRELLFRGERTYRYEEWYSIYPQGSDKEVDYRKPPMYHKLNSGVDALIHRVVWWGIDFKPEFQRDYVWTDQDKERYLDSVFAHRDIGYFIFWKQGYPSTDIIVDGKQRLSTLVDFYLGKTTYKGHYFHELKPGLRNHFSAAPVVYSDIPENETLEAVLELFIESNSGGVPQTPEHLESVKNMLRDLEMSGKE